MENKNLIVKPWPDYEILDSGGNRKLERWGKYILIRPETQAIWEPQRPELWRGAQAEFKFVGARGAWKKTGAPESWELAWRDVRFSARLGSFKHLGIFPEQAANWEWIGTCLQNGLHDSSGSFRLQTENSSSKYSPSIPSSEVLGFRSKSPRNSQTPILETGPLNRVKNMRSPKVLNLFGYTGIASIVAAQAGAEVTHVDASKQSNAWAKENAELSGVPAGAIRFLNDDVMKFVLREVRRGAEYDGIILDPPAFGRGPSNEVWRIEEHLPRLLREAEKILSKKPGAFFLLNGYAAGYSATSFMQVTADVFPKEAGEFGELQISESGTGHVIPSGIYVRFVR
ncbi:MAG: class I SAM-dependent methyltransferase [Minisyncoccia bacterium]